MRDRRPMTTAERRFAEVRDLLTGRSAGEVFDFIYHTNLWGSPESRSGVGSESGATATLRTKLPELLRRLGVRVLVDVPCGDFSWLGGMGLPLDRYIGGDIVSALVARNVGLFARSHPHADFRLLDISTDLLPAGDALLCRDCLVHLPEAMIRASLRNIARSPIRYVIMTTFLGDRENADIETGNWRPLNLQRPPYSLPPPLEFLLEGCMEEEGAYADKALGVWSAEQIARAAGAGR